MAENISPEFWQGINEFNQQQFYACHDTLEALWMEAGEPEKRFYQGILQIAVSLYHLSNENWQGAVILMGEGISRLGYYQPSYFNIDVDKLVTETATLLKALQASGKENVQDFLLSIDQNSMINFPKISTIYMDEV